jgi:hypothetical protein
MASFTVFLGLSSVAMSYVAVQHPTNGGFHCGFGVLGGRELLKK